MTKFLTYLISLAALLGLNIVFPKIAGAAPNFLFLFAVFYAIRKDDPVFLWLAFFAGILLDVYSGSLFGSNTLAFLIISFIINYTTRTFLTADPTPEFISVVIIISYIILIGLLYLFDSFGLRFGWTAYHISPEYITLKIWLDIALNLIFALPVYYLVVFNDRIITKYEKPKNVL